MCLLSAGMSLFNQKLKRPGELVNRKCKAEKNFKTKNFGFPLALVVRGPLPDFSIFKNFQLCTERFFDRSIRRVIFIAYRRMG